MRIDKWLWSMRLYKTRSIAAEACKNNRVLVNDALIKASREVKLGDKVSVKKMPVIYSYRITQMPKSRMGAANVPLYMDDITPQSEKDKLLQQVSVYIKRDKGTGRPTKKERRDIDTLMGTSDFDMYNDLWSEEDEEIYTSSKKKSSEEIDSDEDIDFNF